MLEGMATMAKKRGKQHFGNHPRRDDRSQGEVSSGGNLLKDLLNDKVVDQLKNRAKEVEQEEKKKLQAKQEQEAEKRRQEKKKLENDFSYLLENSDSNWNKYK